MTPLIAASDSKHDSTAITEPDENAIQRMINIIPTGIAGNRKIDGDVNEVAMAIDTTKYMWKSCSYLDKCVLAWTLQHAEVGVSLVFLFQLFMCSLDSVAVKVTIYRCVE